MEMATATDNMETGDEEAEQGEAERVVEEVLEAGEDVECEPCWWKTSGCTFEGKHNGPCSTRLATGSRRAAASAAPPLPQGQLNE